jgi:diacylglycerol kinase
MKRWLNSFSHAFRGIIIFLRFEPNARIEAAIAILVIGLGLWLQIPAIEFVIILLCIGSVLAAEAFNTAVERTADFHSREVHPEIRDIKDLSAGAVLICACISAVIGLIIFVPRIWSLIFS